MTKKQIKFVKGYLFKSIGVALNLSVEEIDIAIKNKLEIESISKLDNDGYMEICVYCFKLGDELGLNLNFKGNEAEFIRDLL
jgi:hypothetical protein